jgi:voltage-dependent potassium channel beta subunit
MPNTNMLYRSVGKSGLKVSALSLGGWTTFGGSVEDSKTISTIIHAAFDAGINFFDIADVYARGKAEEMMGSVLRALPRHELVISSKVFWPMSDDINDRGLSRKHIMESVEKSLKRIGTDYLDLYFCHRFDPETPLEETARAMDDLVHQGKVLYWGTSEWMGTQLQEINELTEAKTLYAPIVEQPQYSLLKRTQFEDFVQPAASRAGMGLVVWSPLASGLLSGKYNDGVPADSRLAHMDWLHESLYKEDNLKRVRAMATIAKDLGCTQSQLALAWALAGQGVSSVITGATRIEQLQENLEALSVQIDSETNSTLNEIFPKPKT